ncbi:MULTISPECIES: IS21 family transposase, partial [unclassified Oceanispirochaeta]|uniref:IS21 family transposase n=1 Tax=unclassified Oceanispirochaeta TaxID=2635722 RepID=UPI000E0966B0
PQFAKELKKTGVTLQLLWEEYRIDNPDGLKYTQFCYHFQQWKADENISMHLEHKAGEKLFVDYAGKKREIVNPITGEIVPKEIFVAILPSSQLTYIEASDNQKKESFIRSLERAIHFFGGVTAAIVPDNLKSAVVKANFYEPEINPLLEDFADYYCTAILPARSGRPQDKAHVENAVKIAYRRIIAPLRNQSFHSTESLNQAMWEKLKEHNETKLTRMTVSRRELFEDVERCELRSLPVEKYPLKYFQDNTLVGFNYHFYLKEDGHYYSAPYLLKGKKVRIIYDDTHVALYHDNIRIWQHRRERRRNGYTTVADHMPAKHRYFKEWSPEKFRWWAGNVGEDTLRVINYLLESKPHPEQAFRTSIGILNLTNKYPHSVVNQACRSSWNMDWIGYKSIAQEAHRIQEELEAVADDAQLCLIPDNHPNIRGEKYYQ